MATTAREEHVYMAKLSEEAERYEEMVEFMEKVSNSLSDTEELTVEEEMEHVTVIKEYRSKIEKELSDILRRDLKLLDLKLVPSAGSGDSKVFYLKMNGDYHRYLAEFKTVADWKETAESTLNAYMAALVRVLLSYLHNYNLCVLKVKFI
ncbi:putative 14-3-3 protein [Helianthus annuus]|uniref:14-3-3 protein n=1 Tax=Helianthus annuus TaxID=4232 RepID=A0A251UPV4_HELAN|nr:putative 14-3-3 protein [Helianthus annuus]KAJ0577124.1 putative 14-3-3 protein [Helianthus annuus]KAJ0584668.1 putative 14-3-3 protein [Helianthus annuus]KAJ0750335.1 putative 14-3-3 protein [Helianthus annuus]KAJ0919069.1 putative 14-3-3 protein [Helianthus annuus]